MAIFHFKTASSILLLSYMLPVFSMNSPGLDEIFRSINLPKLINTHKAVNLQAQMKDPLTSTTDVNDLLEMIAVGVIFDDKDQGSTIVAEFDLSQAIIKKIIYPEPWIGVDEFVQSEIPAVSLQDGLGLVRKCMADKGEPLPEQITRVAIYKTLQTSSMVYDYSFRVPEWGTSRCQEILYIPETGQCEKGLIINCHYVMPSVITKIK